MLLDNFAFQFLLIIVNLIYKISFKCQKNKSVLKILIVRWTLNKAKNYLESLLNKLMMREMLIGIWVIKKE